MIIKVYSFREKKAQKMKNGEFESNTNLYDDCKLR